jgi:DNA-binding transcriptional LysR family regulator
MKQRTSSPARLDLNLMRVLYQLLRCNSVSEAAAELGITQSATSNALRRLREHFGDDLLVRSGRRMTPTKRAEQLRPLVEEATASALKAFALAPPFVAREAKAQIRIATSDHIVAVVLEPLIHTLTRIAPGIELQVEPFSRSAADRLRAGDIDLLVAPRTNLGDEFRVARLLEEPFAVVRRRGHPRARTKWSLQEYTQLDHVLVAPGGGTRSSIDNALAVMGLHRKIRRYSAVFSYALLLVAETDLVATVPWSFARRFAGSLRLELKPLPISVSPARIDVGWSRRMDKDPVIQWLRQQLIATARREITRLVPAGAGKTGTAGTFSA